MASVNVLNLITKWTGISPGWVEAAAIALGVLVAFFVFVAIRVGLPTDTAPPRPAPPDKWKRGSSYWQASKDARYLPFFVRVAQGFNGEHRESDFHD